MALPRTPRDFKAFLSESKTFPSSDTASYPNQSLSNLSDADLRRKYAKLKALSEDDQQLVAQLRQQLSTKSSELLDCQSALRSLRRTYEDLSVRSASDREQLERVYEELRQFRRERLPSARSTDNLGTNNSLFDAQQRIIALEKERDHFKQEFEKLSKSESEVHNKKRIQEISLRQLTSQCTRFTSENELLHTQLKQLREQLNISKEKSAKSEAQCLQYRTEIEGLRRSMETIKNEMDETEDDYSVLIENLEVTRKDLLQTQRSKDDVEAQNMSLIDQINALQSEISSKNLCIARDWEAKCLKDRQYYQIQIENMKQSYNSHVAELDGEIHSLRDRVNDLLLQNERHLETNLMIKQELAEERANISGEKLGFTNKYNEEREKLLENIRHLQSEKSRLESKLTVEINASNVLRDQVRNLESEVSKLQLNLSGTCKSAEDSTQDLNQKLKKMIEERDQLKTRLTSVDQELTRVKTSFRSEIQRLSDSLAASQAENSTLKIQISELNELEILQNIKKTGVSLASTGLKLQKTIDAFKTDLSCISCFKIMDKPTVLLSCGHHFCLTCVEKMNGEHSGCFECGQNSGEVVPNARSTIIERLLAKYVYMNKVTEELATSLENLEGILSKCN
ncbi:hypothetical protein RCL1_006539 [Eukaryota sp. TZLM3-RCL]